jgi:hypothetical protein
MNSKLNKLTSAYDLRQGQKPTKVQRTEISQVLVNYKEPVM